MRLKGRIMTAMASVAIVIAIVLSFVNYAFSIKNFEKELDGRIQLTAENAAAQMNQWMGQEKYRLGQMVDDIVYNDTLKDLDYARAYMKDMVGKNENVLDYYAQMDNKQFICHDLTMANADLTGRDWYVNGKKAKGFYISDPYLDMQYNKLIVTISMPFTTKSGEQGVFGADILIDRLLTTIEAMEMPEGYEGFIINGNGDFLAHSYEDFRPDNGKFVNIVDTNGEEITAVMLNEDVNLKDRKIPSAIDGLDRYFYFGHVDEADWYMGITVMPNVMTGTLNKTILITFVIMGVIMAASLGTAALISNSISKPIHASVDILKEIGELNLNVEIPEEYFVRKDEIGDMSKAFAVIVDKLKIFMINMKEAVDVNNQVYAVTMENLESLNLQGEETSAITQQLSAGMEETSATTETIIGSVDSIYESINDFTNIVKVIDDISNGIKDHSEVTNETFVKSREHTRKKYTVAKDNIEEAIESAKEVEKIGILTDSITAIADQTTLLSLNAAIEAARAGEAGRGFEIVAREIRKLAEDSNEAADQIKTITGLISDSILRLVRDTKDLVNLMEENVMKDYDSFVKDSVESRKNGISLNDSVQEIVKRSSLIEENVSSINQSMRDIVLTIEESTKATVVIAEKNMTMVESIHDINGEMNSSKESGEKLEILMSEVNIDQASYENVEELEEEMNELQEELIEEGIMEEVDLVEEDDFEQLD